MTTRTASSSSTGAALSAPPAVAVELFSTSILSNHKVRSRHERFISILRVKNIPFVYHDLAGDEEAKRRWRRKALDQSIPGLLVHDEWRGTFEEFEEAIEFGELELFLKIDQERAVREAAEGIIPQPAVQQQPASGSASTTPKKPKAKPRKSSKHAVVKTVPGLAQPRAPSMTGLAPALPFAAPRPSQHEQDAPPKTTDEVESFLRDITDADLTDEQLNEVLQAGESTAKRRQSVGRPDRGKYPSSLGLGTSSESVPRTYVPSAEAGTKPLRLARMGNGSSSRQASASPGAASPGAPHARYNASTLSSAALAAEAKASTLSRSFKADKLREALSQGDDLASAMSQTRLASNTDSAEHVVGRENLDDLFAELGLKDAELTEAQAESFLFEGEIPAGLGSGGERLRRSGSTAEQARNEAAARNVAQRARAKGHGSNSSQASSISSSSLSGREYADVKEEEEEPSASEAEEKKDASLQAGDDAHGKESSTDTAIGRRASTSIAAPTADSPDASVIIQPSEASVTHGIANPDAEESDFVDSNAVDSDAVESGAVELDAVESDAVESMAPTTTAAESVAQDPAAVVTEQTAESADVAKQEAVQETTDNAAAPPPADDQGEEQKTPRQEQAELAPLQVFTHPTVEALTTQEKDLPDSRHATLPSTPSPPQKPLRARPMTLELDSSFSAMASQIQVHDREEPIEEAEEPAPAAQVQPSSPPISSSSPGGSPDTIRRSLASAHAISTPSSEARRRPTEAEPMSPSSSSNPRSPASGSRTMNRRRGIDVQRKSVGSSSEPSLSPPPPPSSGSMRRPSGSPFNNNGNSGTGMQRNTSQQSTGALSDVTYSPESVRSTKSPKSASKKFFSLGRRRTKEKDRRGRSTDDAQDSDEDIPTTTDASTTALGGRGGDRSQKTLSVILREADEALAGDDDGDDDEVVGSFDFDIDGDDGIEMER